MREDSIAKLDFFKGRIPNLFDNYLRIDRLDRDQAREAIVRPIEQFNDGCAPGTRRSRSSRSWSSRAEPGHAGRVASAGRAKAGWASGDRRRRDRVETPHLQLVMTRLWQEETAAGSRCCARTLERLGGAGHIVATHVDAALDALTAAEREAAAAHLPVPRHAGRHEDRARRRGPRAYAGRERDEIRRCWCGCRPAKAAS